MLHEIVADPTTPASEPIDLYRDALRAASREGDDGDLDSAVRQSVARGDVADLTVEQATAVLAAESSTPPAEALAAEARDDLLMAMTRAVVDVDTLAARLDGDFGPRDIQQKVEGRAPMSLQEYVRIRRAIEA